MLLDSVVNLQSSNIPPHLKHVATLPCEILMPENKRQFETGTVINYKS